ncbi:hypothetical protein HKX48_004348 [Thoreauomyces humboldtii]|nr:hypothetical protein HKX48_004348 [Thoreauomyces humboldtii]
MATTGTGGGGGVAKVLDKLAASVQDGNYYEAHQMYHSVCQRYLKQKKYASALELLHQGSKNMLQYNQIGSAADLAQRMLDLYESESLPVDATNRSRLLDVFQSFPLRTEQCDNYVRACIKWSGKHGNCPTGDQAMHHAIGSRYYKERQYYDAEYHFAYGTLDSARAWAHMAWEWSGEGYFPDRGYFLARIVLPYLALKKLSHATASFDTFVNDLSQNDPSLRGTTLPFSSADGSPSPDLAFYASSLINLCQLLLVVVQRDATTQFSTLKSHYRDVYAFDGYLNEMMDRIAVVWFDLGPKKMMNPLEDIMKSLFAGAPSAPAPRQQAQILEMD